jgi:hypothetical protein
VRSDSKLGRADSGPIAGATILGTALIAVGVLVDPPGVLGDLIAGAAGLAFEVVIALFLVERVAARQRRREWATVGGRTTRAIKHRIWNIGFAYYLEGADMPLDEGMFLENMRLDQSEHEIMAAIFALSVAMRAVHSAAPPANSDADDGDLPVAPEQLHAAVAEDFSYIKTILTPRVITLSSDPKLADLLLTLEDHEEAWQGWMQTAKEWGAPDSLAWRKATEAIETAALIYERLADPEPGLGRQDAGEWGDIPH